MSPSDFNACRAGCADDLPQLVGEHQAQDESDADAGQRLQNAAAQLLQVLHEGHAQHAVIVVPVPVVAPATGGDGPA